MKTYSLDQAGVTSWQNDLYQSSEQEQALEREFIHSDFEGWLTERFGATGRQLNYLDTLSTEFVHMLRDELVLSLRAQLDIEFDRRTLHLREDDPDGDSVKVTELRKRLKGEEEGEEEEPTDPTSHRMNGSGKRKRAYAKKGRFIVRTYHRRR